MLSYVLRREDYGVDKLNSGFTRQEIFSKDRKRLNSDVIYYIQVMCVCHLSANVIHAFIKRISHVTCNLTLVLKKNKFM